MGVVVGVAPEWPEGGGVPSESDGVCPTTPRPGHRSPHRHLYKDLYSPQL